MSLPCDPYLRQGPSPRHGHSPAQGSSPAEETPTPRGRLKLRSKAHKVPPLNLAPLRERKRSGRRRPLAKNRIYLQTPDNFYNYHRDDPRDVTSSYQGQGSFRRSLDEPLGTNRGRKIVFEKVFSHGSRSRPRKAMIIGERPPLWRLSAVRRPELPGNLFVDNLRHQDVDYRQYSKVTWNDILESHLKDVNSERDLTQTLPQKEQWLASIDARVRYSKMNSDRGLPYVSPRLFSENVHPTKPPIGAKYVSKDKAGNVFYIVGPSDVTRREYKSYLLPEIVKRPSTPKKLNF